MSPMVNGYPKTVHESQTRMNNDEREALIREKASLVKYIADRIAMRLPSHISTGELISAGTMGLLNAIDDFDTSKGVKFDTYASYRIKGAVLDELRRMDWVPRSIRQDIKNIEKAVEEVRKKYDREPTDIEIAEEMGVDIDSYYKILQQTSGINLLSLDEKKPNRSDTLLSTLASDTPSSVEALTKKELKNTLVETLKKLTEKEQKVLSLYYYEELTLKEIAAVLELTESRISQIHSKAIISLRLKLKKVVQ